MIVQVDRVTSTAGVSRKLSDSFSSMEINDQVNGKNGGITGAAQTGSKNIRTKNRVLVRQGVVNQGLTHLSSKSFGTAGL